MKFQVYPPPSDDPTASVRTSLAAQRALWEGGVHVAHASSHVPAGPACPACTGEEHVSTPHGGGLVATLQQATSVLV